MNHTQLADLVDRLSTLSATWLPPTLAPSDSLHDALSEAHQMWPTGWDDTEPASSPLLFPFPYARRAQVSPALFHQLLDAACEAQRAATQVVLVAVPTARSGPQPHAAETADAVARLYQDAGFAVTSAGDVCDLRSIGTNLITRACASPLTRRQVDLTDVLVAAAADALDSEWVYRTDGVGVGKHLGALRLCPPLCRLYDPGDPFASPPPGAKRPPAGSDAVWAAALTLGATGVATPPTDRASMAKAVSSRLRPLWKSLQRQRLCGSAPEGDTSALRLRVTGPAHSGPVAVPLFGAPVVADSTQRFVSAAALAGRPMLVVDDLTPRICYDDYPADAARASYEDLAAAHDGTVAFVCDIADLTDRLGDVMPGLTVGQVTAASANRRGRRRGGLTGHDAIHLATMALACSQHPETVAVRSANVAAVHAMAPVVKPSSLVTVTGDNPDMERWQADIPARFLAQEGHEDDNRRP